MTQAATFGRRAPVGPAPVAQRFAAPRAAAPAPSWPSPPSRERAREPEPAGVAPLTATMFNSADDELEDWKSARRARIWSYFGVWRWVGVGSAGGAAALVLSGYDPGHLAGPMIGVSLLSWFRGYMRYRKITRLVAEAA